MRIAERNTRLHLVAALCACGLATSSARAQANADSRHVLLAADIATSGGGPVSILRRPNAQVVILVSTQATPEELLRAIGTIGLLRALHDTVTAETTMKPGVHLKASPSEAKQVTRMEILLEQLRHAPATLVQGVGNVAALELDLGPTPHLRAPSQE
jgi:hypothetical protein